MAKRQNDKEEHMGYINFVSPKKKTTYGGTHFDVTLQNSPTTPIKVKMFGDENHRKCEAFRKQKSPVKMRLTYNSQYRNFQMEDRETIRKCNPMEVAFPPNDDLAQSGGAADRPINATVETLKFMPLDNSKYFNVRGRIVMGKQKPFKVNSSLLKEDMVLVDESGYMTVKVWGEKEIKSLEQKGSYNISHLKLRRRGDQQENFLTTSPLSIIRQEAPFTIRLPPVNFFPDQVEVLVPRVVRLAGIDHFFSCNSPKCGKKMDIYASTEGVVQCQHCNGWMDKDSLIKSTLVRFVISITGSETQLTGNKEILSAVVDDWSKDANIAYSLLHMKNFRVTYSLSSSMVMELKTEQEEFFDFFEDQGGVGFFEDQEGVEPVKEDVSVEEVVQHVVQQLLQQITQ